MAVTKYRKCTKEFVIVEAEVYRPGLEDGFDDWEEIPEEALVRIDRVYLMYPRVPYINTPEGKRYISPGDWIVTEVNGERYPCEPALFEAIYKPVEAEAKGEE